MKRSTKFISIGLLISFAAACGGSNDESGRVKNAALPVPTTKAPAKSGVVVPIAPSSTIALAATSELASEPGGIIAERVSLSWDKYAQPAYRPPILDVYAPTLPSEQFERLKMVAEQIPFLPMIVRLPVAYDPAKRAAELSTSPKSISTDGLSERPKAGRIPVITSDLAIIAATKALSDHLDSTLDSQWLTRSVTASDLVRASNLFLGMTTTQSGGGTAQTKPVTGADFVAQLGQVPFVRALLSPVEVEELVGKGLILSASVDTYESLNLDEATVVIGSDEPTTFGTINGAGTTIAIFDTGVLASHPAFGNRVVRQRCFDSTANCPNGRVTDTSANSALPCTFSSGCDHGTHVAGIAAGAAVSTATIASPAADGSAVASGANVWHAGVAPAANILAYRTAGIDPSDNTPGFANSDFILAAGDLAAIARQQNVVALNHSVGSDSVFADVNCDNSLTTFPDLTVNPPRPSVSWDDSARVAAINTLTALNVAVVNAAGNAGSRTFNSSPGCLDGVVSVSATANDDTVAVYSNVSPGRTDLFAPGGDSLTSGGAIIAPSADGAGVNTAVYEAKQGTSMAAPMVTGAWALVRQLKPDMDVASVLALLKATGKGVTDTRAGGSATKPRLNLSSVLPAETNTGSAAATNTVATYLGRRTTASQGVALSKKSYTSWGTNLEKNIWEGNAVFPAMNGIAPATLDAAWLFFTTRGGKASAVAVEDLFYTPVQTGFSASPCRSNSPMRSYRVPLNLTDIRLSNVLGFRIKVKVPEGVVVDGVSVFLVSRPLAGMLNTGSVVISDGLSVMNAESAQMSAALRSGMDVSGRPVTLHVAVADGQAAGESGLILKTSTTPNGRVLTPPNQFNGSDGYNWDDHTYNLAGKGLTGIPSHLVLSHAGVPGTSQRDCLAFVATMLNTAGQPPSGWPFTATLATPLAGAGLVVERGIVRPTVNFTPLP